MSKLFRLWREEEGQDIAEYAVMLAVILVIVVGTVRLIGRKRVPSPPAGITPYRTALRRGTPSLTGGSRR